MKIDKELEELLAAKLDKLGDKQVSDSEEDTFKFEDVSKAIKPIVSNHVMTQLHCGIAALENMETWKEWGFTSTNSVLEFFGPPGTGKTTAARWLGKQIGRRVLIVSYADIGSEKPGEPERNIHALFAAARRRKALLFFDEAEGLIRNRASLSSDEQWLISMINTMLTEIERYDGVVVLATNMPELIDPAILRRVAYRVQFVMPDEPTRLKLWRVLWPKTWPLDYSGMEINKLVKRYPQTGANIKMAIECAARVALVESRKPTWKDLDLACQQTIAA